MQDIELRNQGIAQAESCAGFSRNYAFILLIFDTLTTCSNESVRKPGACLAVFFVYGGREQDRSPVPVAVTAPANLLHAFFRFGGNPRGSAAVFNSMIKTCRLTIRRICPIRSYDMNGASNIYYVGGNKSGVGKTRFSFALTDYLLNRERNVLLVDTDTDNPDVFKAHKDLALANLPCLMNSFFSLSHRYY
ncbi:MAG: ParA family protein [Desulfovibrio sp.]|jgi:hypothetical protein|nr:ParA family protein [Desulfovibrio sp.]